jgi:hypothetical protein
MGKREKAVSTRMRSGIVKVLLRLFNGGSAVKCSFYGIAKTEQHSNVVGVDFVYNNSLKLSRKATNFVNI